MKYLLIAIALVSCFVPAPIWAEGRPNVILILTDDQGYGDLSCHGNPVLKTPNLDKLAGESVRFTNHHVAPMCTPTRGELLTGISAFRNGATAVCEGRSMPRRELTTLAQIFQKNGYATGHFGKWHLGDSHPYRPHDRGFDVSLHNQAWGVGSLAEHWQNNCFDDRYWLNNELKQYPGYNTDVFFDEAMAWIGKQEKPFFLYLPTTAAHAPFNVPEKYTAAYQEMKPAVRNFFGMIANIDENVGRLEAFLRERDLRENTILIFMTDNGTVLGHQVFNAGMRGHKMSEYDGGHRVPFFLRWDAAKLDAPRDVKTLSHSTDLAPTLVDLCQLEVAPTVRFDGQSLKPLLDGKEEDFADRKVVIQYRAQFKEWGGAVLWNQWRLVLGKELYDISTDPGQKKNVYHEHPEVVAAMRKHYEDWLEETKPVMEQINYFSVGSPAEPVTWLTACNWTGSYCDNWGNLARGNRFGHWNILAESSGDYEVSMYMFHPDAKTALNKPLNRVPARPIALARLIVDGNVQTLETDEDATHATFRISLEKGQKAKLEGKFLSAEGKPLFGAGYTFVKRVE